MHFQHHQCWPIATTNRLATNPTQPPPTIAARIVASTIASGFRDNHWKSQCEGCEHKNCRRSLNPCTNVFLSAVTHILDITCFSCISHSVTNALQTPPMLAKQANPATNLTSSSSYLLFFNNLSTFLQNLNRGGSQTPLTHTNLESPKSPIKTKPTNPNGLSRHLKISLQTASSCSLTTPENLKT